VKRHGRDLESNSGQDQSGRDKHGRIRPLPRLGKQEFRKLRGAGPGIKPGNAHHQESGGETPHHQQLDARLKAGRLGPVKRRQQIKGDADQLERHKDR